MSRLNKADLERRLEFSERKRTLLHGMLARRSLEEDTFLWSIADLMTLILIFFVLFYTHAIHRDLPEEKATQPSRLAESSTSVPADSDPTPNSQHAPMEDRPEKRDESLEHLRHEVMSALDDHEVQAFTARWDQRRLVFVLGERITFRVAEASLLDDFQPVLRRVAGAIASQKGYRVVVSGHTDDTPICTDKFPSNWELSAARALSVARFLIGNGVEPQRVTIQGFSSYRPLFQNISPERKQANRRVEIALVKGEQGTTF